MEKIIRISIVLFICSIFVSVSYSQSVTLTVLNPNVRFAINHIKKYEDGVSYVDFTKLRLEFVGANGDNFKVSYNTTAANIEGYGGGSLALNTVCVEATQNAAKPLVAVYNGRYDLVQAPASSELVSNGTIDADPKSGDIDISYWFGVDQTAEINCSCAPNQLFDTAIGSYFVDLTFTIEVF